MKVYFRCPHCGYYEIIWKKYGRLVQGPIFYRGVNVASVDRATMTVGERFLERKFRDWISESRRNGKRVLEAAVSGSSLHVYYYPSTNTVEEEEENKERYRLLEVSKEDFLRAFVGMKSKPGFFDLVERGWFSTDGEVRERISSFNRTLKREFAQSAACRGNGQVDDRIVNFLETINSDSVHAADLKQDQMADLADDLCRALFPPPRLMLLSWELGEEFTRRLKSQGANLLVGERLRLEEKGLSGYPGDSGGFKE